MAVHPPEKSAVGRLPYPHLADRMFGRPLMVHPAKADAIIAGLGSRLLGAEMLPDKQAFTAVFGERREGGYRLVDGVGVLDVFGVLAHFGGFGADSSYVLGYERLAGMFAEALVDDDAKSVVLNMDTPGGEVAGVFEFAELVYQARGSKPIHAAVGDMAASAGYLIASAADSISITSNGVAGSIGVVMRHVDVSAAMKMDGVQVTHIFSGAHKVDGNQFEPLTDAVRGDLQAECDRVYDMFVQTVARNRGIEARAVRATEARVYSGQLAVDVGLADVMESPDQLIARLSGRSDNQPEAIMPKEETQPQAAETNPGELAARYDAGLKAGATAERERIGAILGCDAAKGREASAHSIAMTTELDAEAATSLLATLPLVPATAEVEKLSPLAAAMHKAGTPGVGDGGGDAAAETSPTQTILSNYNAATGVPINH